MKIENGVLDTNFYSPSQNAGQQSRTESTSSSTSFKVSDIQPVDVQEERAPVNEHEVIQAIERANKHIRTYDRKLEFSIHDITKQIMVKVINTENDTVIREIPSEKILDMVAHLWKVAGILVDEKR